MTDALCPAGNSIPNLTRQHLDGAPPPISGAPSLSFINLYVEGAIPMTCPDYDPGCPDCRRRHASPRLDVVGLLIAFGLSTILLIVLVLIVDPLNRQSRAANTSLTVALEPTNPQKPVAP
jgi:hypothetical protein